MQLALPYRTRAATSNDVGLSGESLLLALSCNTFLIRFLSLSSRYSCEDSPALISIFMDEAQGFAIRTTGMLS